MATKGSDPVRERVSKALAELNADMATVSKAIGRNHAYLFQFLTQGKPAELPERVREALSAVIGVPEAELRHPGPPAVAEAPKPSPITALRAPLPIGSAKDLPVYASAEGGPGGMIFETTPIDYVIRPDPLANVRRGYAMYVVGDSMRPAFQQGDLALINPHLPYQPDDDVLIYRHGEDSGQYEATVKRLRRATAEQWLLTQFNPVKDFSLPRKEWPTCHVIVGKYARR